MQQRIIIEPNKSTFQYKTSNMREFTNKKEINSSLFLRRMLSFGAVTKELIPRNVRYMSNLLNHQTLYILEYPPQMRTINLDINLTFRRRQFKLFYKNDKDALKYINNKSGHRFNLLFPYVIFSVKVQHDQLGVYLQVFFRKSPLVSMKDRLYKAPFYNIGSGQSVCMDRFYRESERQKSPTLLQFVEETIEKFWTSRFNYDLDTNIRSYACRRGNLNFSNYYWWEYISQTDPMQVLTRRWIPSITLEHSIRTLVGLTQYNMLMNYTFNRAKDAFLL